MTTSNFTNINLDQIIADAIKGDKEALDSVRFSESFTTQLHKISAVMAFKYRLDAEEIRDTVFDTLSSQIQTIKNPKCLFAWCWTVAERVCLNMIRHRHVVEDHAEREAAAEKAKGARISKEGVPIPLPSSDINSQHNILLEKEFRENVYLEVKRALASTSPMDLRIVICWGAGLMNLSQISQATAIPLSTVATHLSNWQREILKGTLLQEIVNENPKHRAGAYEMIQNAIKKEFNRAA